MNRRTSSASLRAAIGLLDVQALRLASDAALLRRFVHDNDEAAFRVIAERHGPMVLGVCRRALRSTHDAEDAFQATFLVFSRRAASIRKSTSLGSWFHGVAMRVVMNLRREQTRRQRREQAVGSVAAENATDTSTWAEIKTGLDEELGRLPEHQRTVLVLCYLEGRTRDEAAQQLGLTLSALHGRLERGRKLLAARLTKRGLTLSAVFLSVAISPESMFATVRAASLFAARQSIEMTVAPSVVALTSETLRGMTMKTTKWAIASLACSAILAVCVGFTTAQPPVDSKNKSIDLRMPLTPTNAAKPADADENLKNTLLALDKHMWEAGEKGDWKERQKFLADDLVSVSILGKYGKADAALADQRLKNKDGVIRDPVVVRVSPDVAILTYRYDCKIITNDGKLVETCKDHRVVFTWAYRNGGWVIVFCHDDHGRNAKPQNDISWLDDVYDLRLEPRIGSLPARGNFDQSIKSSPTQIDLHLLKTKVELAKLSVKENELRLEGAVQKNADRNQIELLKIEVERARLLVKEGELNLSAAQSGSTPTTNTPSRK